MTTQARANILNHLSQVNHNSFAGYSIRTFIESAHTRTDDEIVQCISEIQTQIRDNRGAMKTVLGNQYGFINSLKIEAHDFQQS